MKKTTCPQFIDAFLLQKFAEIHILFYIKNGPRNDCNVSTGLNINGFCGARQCI